MAEDASLCLYLLMRLKNIIFVKFFNIMNCDIDCIKVGQFLWVKEQKKAFLNAHIFEIEIERCSYYIYFLAVKTDSDYYQTSVSLSILMRTKREFKWKEIEKVIDG